MAEIEWNDMASAPRDGTWVILEGEFDGGDTSSTRIGRCEPKTFRIGSQDLEYEWRIFEEQFYGVDAGIAQPKWNWSCDGRVSGWLPLPSPDA
jgi:hypothetical protein